MKTLEKLAFCFRETEQTKETRTTKQNEQTEEIGNPQKCLVSTPARGFKHIHEVTVTIIWLLRQWI